MKFRLPAIFWIVLAALLIRLFFLLKVPPPLIHRGGDDAIYYHVTGLQLREYFLKAGPLLKEFSAGHLFQGRHLLEKYGLEIPWGAFKKTPVYPVFVALCYGVMGADPFWIFVVQALLVSLVCALCYGMAKELGQEGAGLLCALLVGIYPPFIFIVTRLLQESLSLFLSALFYVLVFRCRKTNSFWLFGITGIVLLLLSLSKSRLVFFPFFLFVAMGAATPFVHRKIFSARNLLMLILSFSIPYLVWITVVSWQFHRPAVMLERGGQEILSALLPDYDGWTPDSFMAKEPDGEVTKVLKREGILETREGGNGVWPSDSKMIGAGVKIFWRHPWISLRMALTRVYRLWWQPYDWPWREFLLPPEPVRWFHRCLVVAALAGWVLWGFERPLAVWFLSIPLLYGVLINSLFHAENRFVLPFLHFLILFASFFIHLLWKQRKVLLGSFQDVILGLGFVLGGGLIFRLSQPSFMLKFFAPLNVYQAHLLGGGLRSLVLVGFFLGAAFFLRRILSGRRLSACLAVTACFILIPFESNAFTAGDWRGWKAAVRQPTVGIRQEIFLPRGSVGESVARNLRMDLLPPPRGKGWVIRVNGESIGTLETLKAGSSRFLLAPPYSVYLEDAKKQAPRVRQWFSLPIPAHLLKEGAFNAVEIVFHRGDSLETPPWTGEWTLFGDYPVRSLSPQFQGPLFHHSSTEISVFKFLYEGDLRLNGITPLHHQGVKSFYLKEGGEVGDDLSVSPGIQKGEYRIRIEMEDREGKFLVY